MKLIPFYMHPSSWGKKGKERELAQANYNFKDEKLSEEVSKIEAKYEKQEATEKGEPYVTVLRMGIDPDNVVQGYFELDWNDEFVQMLSSAGIQGTSDEDIVNKWFNGVCRTVLLDSERDLDYGMQPNGGRPDVIRRSDIGNESKN